MNDDLETRMVPLPIHVEVWIASRLLGVKFIEISE